MTHQEKITWMALWAVKNKAMLCLEGECGFGRECVGISIDGNYPDYEWNDKDYNRIDKNGDVWTPEHAYHKHLGMLGIAFGKHRYSRMVKSIPDQQVTEKKEECK